ncbi:FtsX-like permease family protein [Kitasatospora sp. CB01950]|uniref:FtsX-like permease family protein n=1 Tax=Kitasatospora sp. CB01950 TaxID=1703930 RepID=UPI00093DFEBE|nr:FtsX-like permease family protein [Kitasatospora sp. CB01950]
MLRLAAATLRQRWTSFLGAFVALALGTTMIGTMALVLTATFGTPHPGPQRFREAGAVVAPVGFAGHPMKAPAVLDGELVGQLLAAGAVADRSFPLHLDDGEVTGHPWSSAAFAGYRLRAGRAPQAPGETVLTGADPQLIGRQAGRYQVVGVVEGRWFERAAFFTDAEAQRLSPGVNTLVSELPAERLNALVAGRAVVLTGQDRTRIDPDDTGGAQALANAQAMAGSTTGLAACVAVFVVVATFAFATEQRRRELALLRLVGAAPRQVRRLVLGEAALIGTAAALLGCALAPVAVGPLRSWMVRHDVAPSWFEVPLHPLPLLVAFVLGVVAALAGSAATLVRVSVIRPAEALRESAVERRGRVPVRLLLGGLLLVGAVVAGAVIASGEPYLAANVRKYQAVPVLYVGAFALLAPVLLPPLVRALTWPLRRSAKAGPMLVRENVLTERRRTAATVAPVVVAVGLVGTLLTVQHSADAALLARQRQEVHATDLVQAPVGGVAERLAGLPNVRVTPVTSMNVKIGTAEGEQLDSLRVQAVPAAAFGRTFTPVVRAGSVDALPADFLVIDEHAAESDGLAVGDRLVALLPTGVRAPVVVAAVVARGLGGDDAYLSASVVGAAQPTTLYLDGASGRLSNGQLDAVRDALAGTGAQLTTREAVLARERAKAAQQADNAAVVVLGIALAYALISVAGTLAMAVAGRRREFALLGLAGAVRRQIVTVVAAEAAIAVLAGTLLAGAAAVLTALTQHVALSHLLTGPPLTVAWPQLTATAALCAAVTLATATVCAARAVRPAATRAQ